MSLWTTEEVVRRIGKTRRQLEYLFEHRPELRPALFSGNRAWCEDDVQSVLRAFKEREKQTGKKTATR